MSAASRNAIRSVCKEVESMLLRKNESYGDSAFEPLRIFSKADAVEQLNVRIDDKLSRLSHGGASLGEDTELDLIGYLILKRAAIFMEREGSSLQREEVAAPDLGSYLASTDKV